MEVILLDDKLPMLDQLQPPRSDGLHLSTVIRDLAITVGILDVSSSDWDFETTVSAGFIWEEVLAKLLGNHLAPRIGEVTLDGIIGTPDGFDPVDWTLEEYKFTWTSSNKDPLDNWLWMTQIKGYMRMLGTNRCRLRIYHVMGDYRGSGPQYRCWQLTAGQHEIDENWYMILNHAWEMGNRGVKS